MQFNHINVVTDKHSWLNQYIDDFITQLKPFCKKMSLWHSLEDIKNGDIIFYLSFSKIVPEKYLTMHKHNLVVHGSALPAGKGWSPLTWQILEGHNAIPMTLFEAQESLDSGPIYLQSIMQFEGHELIDEMRFIQSKCTFYLCLQFVMHYEEVIKKARKQSGVESFYPKRHKVDSKLDTNKTIVELFNLLRVVDNDKYPAFFEYFGHTYFLKIEKCFHKG